MGLDFAIDELYATGWNELDSAGCEYHTDGRVFPRLERICDEFAACGKTLTVRHVELFNCYRAEWRDATGAMEGAVVGHSASEASVYALSQFRRALVGV